MTQRELADMAAMSIGALRDLEQGRTVFPRWATLEGLAAVLGIAGQDLMRACPPGEDASGVRVDVLGPLAAWRAGTRLAMGSVRQRAVLGLLALHHGVGLHRDAIVDALWSDRPPASAVAEVQAYIHRIRASFGAPGARHGAGQTASTGGALTIATVGASYRLEASTDELDLAVFRRSVRDARSAAARGDLAAACRLYERALKLWRGDVLSDVELLRGHAAVVELNRSRADAVMDFAGAATSTAGPAMVLPHLRELCVRERLNEQACAFLMMALATAGQQADALSAFGELRQRLDAELGIRPSALLEHVHLQVLRQEVSWPVPGLPANRGQGTVTGWMTTGPRVGSSSLAWETPAGVMTSTAFGTVDGPAEQTGAVPPGAHTPNVNDPGVAVKARA